MNKEPYEDFQYDSCISRGICSISPRISSLQTVLVLYLRLFAKYTIELDAKQIDSDDIEFILNTISITIYNPEFNEDSFIFAVENFRKVLPKYIEKSSLFSNEDSLEEEKNKAFELFQETTDIIQAIKYGEKAFKRAQEEIPFEIRDLYNIMLVITKSLSINILDLESFDKQYEKGFLTILNLLSRINLGEKDKKTLKSEIYHAAKIDNMIMKLIRESQEKRYGIQTVGEVSYTTIPGKAVLVVGSNIRELETILEALEQEEIDVYTHDDMMLAHTFPKFSGYKRLKGQFGQGIENCLLDFATFPGPIILTKHSLHNIENLYRGRLFTTDYTTSPKGIIKIENNDFSDVIKSVYQSRGFKTGKQCETVTVGYDYIEKKTLIAEKIETKKYKQIFFIGLDGYSLEQKVYFEKLIKLAPQDVLIISFSYNLERDNLIHINTCFDYYSIIKIFEGVKNYGLPIKFFVPKCEKNSISQMIYISEFDNVKVFVGKCTPIILNPSLINTLLSTFNISVITSAKKDLEENIFLN